MLQLMTSFFFQVTTHFALEDTKPEQGQVWE